jgi:hypothetical protein
VPLLVNPNENFLALILSTTNMKLDGIRALGSVFGKTICLFPVSTIGSLMVPFILPSMFFTLVVFIWACSNAFLHCSHPREVRNFFVG